MRQAGHHRMNDIIICEIHNESIVFPPIDGGISRRCAHRWKFFHRWSELLAYLLHAHPAVGLPRELGGFDLAIGQDEDFRKSGRG